MSENGIKRRLYSTEDGVILMDDVDLVLTPEQAQIDRVMMMKSTCLDIPDRVTLLKEVRESVVPVIQLHRYLNQQVLTVLNPRGVDKFDRQVQAFLRHHFEVLKEIDEKIKGVNLEVNIAVSTLSTLPGDFYRIEKGKEATLSFEQLMKRLVDILDNVVKGLSRYDMDWTLLDEEPLMIENLANGVDGKVNNLNDLFFEYKVFIHKLVEFLEIMVAARVGLAKHDVSDLAVYNPDTFTLFRTIIVDSMAILESLQINLQNAYRPQLDLVFDRMELLKYLKFLRKELIRILVKVREIDEVLITPELNVEALNDVLEEDLYNTDRILNEIEFVKKMIVYFRRRLRFR